MCIDSESHRKQYGPVKAEKKHFYINILTMAVYGEMHYEGFKSTKKCILYDVSIYEQIILSY